ncbi:MAG: hypothetical protein SRB1_01458 [Desulfobacteraceae bacterium Eth-SRB1]|nr:MAG: hypothetical protein SRB1_01458 [Desulfobacteraceae bacterium Eth-SRB1]
MKKKVAALQICNNVSDKLQICDNIRDRLHLCNIYVSQEDINTTKQKGLWKRSFIPGKIEELAVRQADGVISRFTKNFLCNSVIFSILTLTKSSIACLFVCGQIIVSIKCSCLT